MPESVKNEKDLTSKILRSHYCVKDIRFMTIMGSKGMETCDGILGISPVNYARHSYL